MSFHVTESGIDTSAVISTVGNFSLVDYGYYVPCRMKISADGTRMAVCTWKGIEMYDFEKCSGKLKNARVIDTTGNSFSTQQSVDNHSFFRDICFSPDGSKLYATFNQFINGFTQPGRLFQYDIGLLSLPAITASKAIIITNLPSYFPSIDMLCSAIVQNPLGEMKCGPDGVLYIDNGSYTCLYPAYVPAGFNPGAAFHMLSQPNLSGLQCGPQLNAIMVNGSFNTYERGFYQNGLARSNLQQNIITAPPPPDTLSGKVEQIVACFKDSLILFSDTTVSCYLWDNGTTDKTRTVFQSGTHWVRYFKDCTVTTDTFEVIIDNQLPAIQIAHQNCPGMHMGKVIANFTDNDPHPIQYTWHGLNNEVIRQTTNNYGDSISGLEAGIYQLVLKTAAGCDTTIIRVLRKGCFPPGHRILPVPPDQIGASAVHQTVFRDCR